MVGKWMTEEPQADMPSRFPLVPSLSLSIYHIYFTLNVRGLYVTHISSWKQESEGLKRKYERKKTWNLLLCTTTALHLRVITPQRDASDPQRQWHEAAGWGTVAPSLHCRDRLRSPIPRRWDVKIGLKPVTFTMCWVHDWDFVGGAAAVSAAPAQRAAGTGPT